jgi:CSLREA domain-containing protein
MAFTVDTLLDENDGNTSAGNFSLREAIFNSIAGESINFAPSLTGGTTALLGLIAPLDTSKTLF